MRCYICDAVIENPQFNADHNDYDPCETCKKVIADTVGAYDDRASVNEDELTPAFRGDRGNILDNILNGSGPLGVRLLTGS